MKKNTIDNLKELGFTHLAELYGVRCYYRPDDNYIVGTNWFNETLIDFFIWLDDILSINDGFKIKLIKEL